MHVTITLESTVDLVKNLLSFNGTIQQQTHTRTVAADHLKYAPVERKEVDMSDRDQLIKIPL